MRSVRVSLRVTNSQNFDNRPMALWYHDIQFNNSKKIPSLKMFTAFT
jgi:hypothetical protein